MAFSVKAWDRDEDIDVLWQKFNILIYVSSVGVMDISIWKEDRSWMFASR